MTQKFFINDDGYFVGSYDGPDDILPEKLKHLRQVPSAPENIRQKWDGRAWLPFTSPDPTDVAYPVH